MTTNSQIDVVKLAALVWIATSACDADERRSVDRERGATPIEMVQTWVGPKNQVLRYEDVAVAGYELFWVQGVDGFGSTGFAVAVPVDEQNFLEGKSALRRLVDTGVADPLDLARLSMMFLERGGTPLVGPQAPYHEEAGVEPPMVEQGVLRYYYERRARTHLELLRTELSLDDLSLRTQSMLLQEHDHPTPGHKPARAKPKNHP